MPPDLESFDEFLKYRTGEVASAHIEGSEPIALHTDDFCRAIRSGTSPRSSALLGLDVVRVIEAAERFRIRNGGPSFLGWRMSAADL